MGDSKSSPRFDVGYLGKRLFDLVSAGLLLAATLPLMGAVAICSLLILGRPVLFRQVRAGHLGRPFTLYKFRSMIDVYDDSGKPMKDSLRLTRYGRILRATSIDELPGLWNVIKGEMSLIGPRPLPIGYSAFYTHEQARRLDVRPGVAGYAALFGRNAQSWESIFAHDCWYVDHASFLLDLRIVVGVAAVILSRKGIDRGEHNSHSEFQRRLESGPSQGWQTHAK